MSFCLQVSDNYFFANEYLYFTVLYLNTMLIQFNILKYSDIIIYSFLGIHKAKPNKELQILTAG